MVRLIYDLQITGHHTEYISYLVDYLVEIRQKDKCFFVVSEELLEKFPEIVEKTKENNNLQWQFISTTEVAKIKSLSLKKRSFAEYALVEKQAELLSATHVILMYFNSFQLSLIFKRPEFTISGILFLQFYRMKTENLKERVKYLRKYWNTKFYCRNKQIGKVFVLNDKKTVEFLNKEFNVGIFQMLLDPVPDLKPAKKFDIRKVYGIESGRKIFLHFGSLDERKGTLDILHSIPSIEEEQQKKICFLFAGKTPESFTHIFTDTIHYYKQHSSVQIVYENRFVENSTMKSLFDQCDCVLIPYKNTESSSGVLGHAVAAGKPVIGKNLGLLGELIKENDLGIVINSPDELSGSIVNFLSNTDGSQAVNNLFLSQRSVNSFAKNILDV